ncbi:hypothetical protein ACJX0J_037784, partial [Zea mays]
MNSCSILVQNTIQSLDIKDDLEVDFDEVEHRSFIINSSEKQNIFLLELLLMTIVWEFKYPLNKLRAKRNNILLGYNNMMLMNGDLMLFSLNFGTAQVLLRFLVVIVAVAGKTRPLTDKYLFRDIWDDFQEIDDIFLKFGVLDQIH